MINPANTVFMFSGQGSHYYQMGRELYDNDAAFRRTLLELDERAQAQLGESVVARLYEAGHKPGESFNDGAVTNAALFMVEWALTVALAEQGVRPDCVLGASIGTYAAAVAAGCLDAETALTTAICQGEILDEETPAGGMVAVLGPPSLHQQDYILRANSDIAAINSDNHFALAGSEGGISRVCERLSEHELTYQRLDVARPFHSSLVNAAEDELRELFSGLSLAEPQVPLVSCATAQGLDRLDAEELWLAVREPIRFKDAITALESRGQHCYLDAGPAGSLVAMLRNGSDVGEEATLKTVITPFAGSHDRLLQLANAV